MEGILILFLFCVAVETSVIKQYHFTNVNMTWYRAQAYCREHYNDLAYIESWSDKSNLLKSAGENELTAWIGLNRDPNNETAWRWSGGGLITFTDWANRQPNNFGGNQTKAVVKATSRGKWNDFEGSIAMPFYCVSLPPVEQSRKTWEEAVSHCRENRTDLVSLRSDTELLLTQALMKRVGTERVWIGLRYLGDHWLWVNGDPLGFQAWPAAAEEDHRCPALKHCGALPKEGAWESVDCQERLHFICN